ncbi:helix-turn-helix domain-containing protein [Mycolicibacterium cosmeticum]|uniref:helix-turn-helix domain-containing protein n=1 Tax=Mycolicibacterium cosmeticum TaxID=258533 RepID=UPI003204D86C
MSTTTTERPNKTGSPTRAPSTVRLDGNAARILRMLGEAAIRLADGEVLSAAHFDEIDIKTASLTPGSDLLTVAEACALLRVSRWMFYRLLHQQRINTVTIGRRRLVPAIEIDRFLSTLHSEGVVR